jgi:hypothetical protein
MTTLMTFRSSAPASTRRCLTIAVTALLLGASACNNILDVNNPGAIQEGQLADPALEQLFANGAVG